MARKLTMHPVLVDVATDEWPDAYAIVDQDIAAMWCVQHAWFIDNYSVRTRTLATGFLTLHRIVTGVSDGMNVRHKNGDFLDCRRENLVCGRESGARQPDGYCAIDDILEPVRVILKPSRIERDGQYQLRVQKGFVRETVDKLRYPFDKMEVGDAFELPREKVRECQASANSYSSLRYNGPRFTVRAKTGEDKKSRCIRIS